MRPLQERHRSPSQAIIDSQSVKIAAMVYEAVGYDAGKKIKGRKRFITVVAASHEIPVQIVLLES